MSLSDKFARSAFARFITSMPGRIIRALAGALLIAWGCVHLGEPSGYVFIIVGLVPLATGGLDLCIISPLLGGPASGKAIRSMNTPT